MKKLILTLLAIVATLSAYAQGRITFASAAPGVNAKFVFFPSFIAVTAADSMYRADLFWSPGSTTVGVNEMDLANQAGYYQLFSSGPVQAGYFTGGTKTVDGWVSGPIVAQVRVWNTSLGSYQQAGFDSGKSDMFVVTPTLSPTPAPNLVGMGDGVIYLVGFIPEPGSAALFSLGAVVLFGRQCRRRRERPGTA